MKKYIILLSFLSILGSSCELESEVFDSINTLTFPRNENDVDALVTDAAYGAFRNDGYSGLFNVASGMLLMSDLTSDYSECHWRDRSHLIYGRWTATVSELTTFYSSYLNFLGKMELTADRIKDVAMDGERLEQYLAELKCGQGWLAFCLYDVYGPVVIADLELLKNPLNEKILPRLSEEEMQNYIESKLLEAAAVLPYSYKKGDKDYGRFTRGLANTVLLKFYMMTGQWEKAVDIGYELMDSRYGYELVPRYKDIFTLNNEKNAETIWAVNCLRGYQEHKWQPHVLPNNFATTPDNITKWGGWRISWPFFHTYERDDQRLETILYEYMAKDGVYHNEEIDVNTNSNLRYGPFPVKYEIDPNTIGEDSSIDWIIYRYADVLTLLAEAIVRNENQVTSSAVELLNRIRVRVGLKAYEMEDFKNPADFLDKLLLERGHEFYYEGVRRQDLIRHGKYVHSMKVKSETLGETTMIDDYMQRWPLPQSAIDEGKGMVEQNPGY